ncbi:MAG: V-type ATP synthase subunit F [Chloroflexota bacterium]
MSRLLIITSPFLVPGFRLAGADAYGAEDPETAEALISGWLDAGESGLLAVDEGILETISPEIVARLRTAERLPFLAIPGVSATVSDATRRARTAQMIRRAAGFHITFRGEE